MLIQPDADNPNLRPPSKQIAATPTRGQARAPAGGQEAGRTGRRMLLLMGSALLLAAPLALFEPAAHWADNPELLRLLRGIAGLKGVMVTIAFTAVWWRVDRASPARLLSS